MASANDPPILELTDLRVSLGGKAILCGISCAVRKGEYLSIVGPNGSGKTTLLKCLVRLRPPSEGSIRLGGRPLAEYSQKALARWMGYVPQVEGRMAPFTVEQFVLLGRYPYLSPFSTLSHDDRQAVGEAMAVTDTVAFRERRMDTLSGGERQRVLVAAALAQGADVLLLDEPTTFLDYRHREELRQLLARLNTEAGTTIVVVTHDAAAAALESDRILALCEGRVAFVGSPIEFMKAAVLRETYAADLLLVPHPQTGLPVIVPHALSARGS